MDPTKETNNTNSIPRQFVFGYGSLINAESRQRTLVGDEITTVIPCIIKGLKRSWSYKCNRNGYTAVCVERRKDSFSNGVLILIANNDALAKLDSREIDYARGRIAINQIEIFGQKLDKDDIVWVYENHNPDIDNFNQNSIMRTIKAKGDPCLTYHAPCSKYPIPESYVDCILQGCLQISHDFAKLFIQTTTGWKNEVFFQDRFLALTEKKYKSLGNTLRHQTIAIDQLLSEVLSCKRVPKF